MDVMGSGQRVDGVGSTVVAVQIQLLSSVSIERQLKSWADAHRHAPLLHASAHEGSDWNVKRRLPVMDLHVAQVETSNR